MNRLCIVIALATLSQAFPTHRAVADSRDELFAQFSREVRQLESQAAPVTVTGRIVATKRSADRRSKPQIEEFEYLAAHGSRLATLRGLGPDAGPLHVSEQVLCIGPGTAFRLSRGMGGPYDILNVSLDQNLADLFEMKAGRYVESAYSVLGTPLSAILDRSGFVFIDAAEIVEDGRRLVRVSYSPNPSEKADKVHLVVDPSLGWAVRSGMIELAGNPSDTITFENEFSETLDGGPVIPSEVTVDTRTDTIYKMTVESVQRREMPVERFSMTHYDLPDLARPEPVRSPLLAWVLGGAVGLLVLSLVLRAGWKRRVPVDA